MKHKGLRLGALFCAAAMTITTSAQALSVEEAYDILRRSYVDRLPRAAKDAESLDELFSYTDNYTCYMTEEEYQAFLSSVEGEVSFAGIGAEITYAPEGISIVSVLKGGGAEKAGLKAGDMIIAIEGESCAPGSEEQRARLVGEAGTQVRVTVRHTDGSEEDYAITRAAVVQTNTTVSAADGVGYIDCDSFGTQTGTYFQDGVRKYDSAVRTWIVDLRGNSGGLTSAAVTALGTFSGAGELVYFVDQSGESSAQRYDGKDLTDKPAIVLMDSGSASASEILAGAIRDNHAGLLVGTKTFGKGVVQSSLEFADGSGMKVTTARYYTPSGECIHEIGIEPDVEVELDEDAVTRYGINNLPHDHDAQLQKAIELLGGTPVLTTATPDEADAADDEDRDRDQKLGPGEIILVEQGGRRRKGEQHEAIPDRAGLKHARNVFVQIEILLTRAEYGQLSTV